MKLSVRFFISWFSSAVVMFLLFYWWHGVFLNDFHRLTFPLNSFLTGAAIVYLVYAAGIYILYESTFLKAVKNFFLRGIFCGLTAGFFLFVIITIFNFSFGGRLSFQYLVIDFLWQITEQIVGAMVIVLCKGFIHEHQTEPI